jgi:NAD(P)H dehydrogenase (quinone)
LLHIITNGGKKVKTLVIISHPNPASFNAAILGVVREELEKKGAEIRIKDLYAMNWNPVLGASDFQQMLGGKMPEDIAREQADISWAEELILISPVWWFSIPAILKGYIDRVFSLGFAYEYTETGPRGLLTGKKAKVITTSGADEDHDRQTGMTDAIKKTVVSGIFGFCGFAQMTYKNCFGVPTVSDGDRKKMLEEIRDFIR